MLLKTGVSITNSKKQIEDINNKQQTRIMSNHTNNIVGQFVPMESIIKTTKERNALKRDLGLVGDALGLSGDTNLSDYLSEIEKLKAGKEKYFKLAGEKDLECEELREHADALSKRVEVLGHYKKDYEYLCDIDPYLKQFKAGR